REVVPRPLPSRDRGHLIQHLLHLRARQALVVGEEVDLAAGEVDRGVRRQLERVVLDAEFSAVLPRPALEPAFTDETPRAGDVDPDTNLKRRWAGHAPSRLRTPTHRSRQSGSGVTPAGGCAPGSVATPSPPSR